VAAEAAAAAELSDRTPPVINDALLLLLGVCAGACDDDAVSMTLLLLDFGLTNPELAEVCRVRAGRGVVVELELLFIVEYPSTMDALGRSDRRGSEAGRGK
jgi:hypothetical protein